MTNNQLQTAIDQFDEQQLKQQARFGIFQFGGGPDESCIRANKEGLTLFAIGLLKAARDMQDNSGVPGSDTIPLHFDSDWVDEESDIFLQYIDSLEHDPVPAVRSNYIVANKLMPIGCGIVAVILLIAVIVGLRTLIKWVF